MTDREFFINEVDTLELSERARTYLEYMKTGKKVREKIEITEGGKMVVETMQTMTGPASAKEIGEKMHTTGRAVSGILRKLCTDEYVVKVGENPIKYELTEKGSQYTAEY